MRPSGPAPGTACRPSRAGSAGDPRQPVRLTGTQSRTYADDVERAGLRESTCGASARGRSPTAGSRATRRNRTRSSVAPVSSPTADRRRTEEAVAAHAAPAAAPPAGSSQEQLSASPARRWSSTPSALRPASSRPWARGDHDGVALDPAAVGHDRGRQRPSRPPSPTASAADHVRPPVRPAAAASGARVGRRRSRRTSRDRVQRAGEAVAQPRLEARARSCGRAARPRTRGSRRTARRARALSDAGRPDAIRRLLLGPPPKSIADRGRTCVPVLEVGGDSEASAELSERVRECRPRGARCSRPALRLEALAADLAALDDRRRDAHPDEEVAQKRAG